MFTFANDEHILFFFWFVVFTPPSPHNSPKIAVDLFCLTGCAVFMWWSFGCLVGVTAKFLLFLCDFALPLRLHPTYQTLSTENDNPVSLARVCHQFCTFTQTCSCKQLLSFLLFLLVLLILLLQITLCIPSCEKLILRRKNNIVVLVSYI